MFYILENGKPKKASVVEWAEFFDKDERIIGNTVVEPGITVSTVFLGIDQNHSGKGKALLFETMVFGGPLDQEGRRYATLGEAKQGHAEMVDKIKRTKCPDTNIR